MAMSLPRPRPAREDAEPSTRELVLRQVDYWRTVYRRTWKGSAITSFVQPWLYVLAMGVLLGSYVEADPETLGGATSYLDFVAPGLLAAHAMTVGIGEVTWPVMGMLKWDRTYFGMIATPLRPRDLAWGHLLFCLFRIASTCAVFVLVLALVGVFASPWGVLPCLAAAVLTGMALSAPVYAFSAGAKSEQGFALIFRLGLMPMFLFSGAFFPISNLPAVLEWLARLTPLWHGVELCRMASLGAWTAWALVHVAYLVVLAAVGAWWSVRRLERRLAG